MRNLVVVMLVGVWLSGCLETSGGAGFDCTLCNAEYQRCNAASRTCELLPGKCATPADCRDATKPVCDASHTCVADSTFNCDSCNSAYQRCNAEETDCELLPGKCATEADCLEPTTPVCNSDHTCVAEQQTGSIYPIRTGTVAEHSQVTVTGTITALEGATKLFIQEPGTDYRGILVYSEQAGSGFALGDEIVVQGEYIEFNDLSEVVVPSFASISFGSGNRPVTTFVSLAVSDLATTAAEPYESMLIEVSGLFTVESHDAQGVTSLVDSVQQQFKMSSAVFTYNYAVGQVLTRIRGVLTYENNTFIILPRSGDDIVEQGDLCATHTCGAHELCTVENGAALCVCDTAAGYFDNGSSCVNPCSDGTNPCTDPNQSQCTPTGAATYTCSCDSGYEIGESGQCEQQACVSMRLMAANITDGSPQQYDETGIRIFQGFKPDIVMIQEFNYKDKDGEESDIRELVDIAFGTDYYYVRGYADDQNTALPNTISNGIISRWPILESGAWGFDESKNRDMDWAIVDIPGERDLFVISVHLRTKSSYQIPQAVIIADQVKAHKDAHPGEYYYVVGGDFNGTSAVSSAGFGKHGDFVVSGPHPVKENGAEETNATGSKQLDFILAGVDFQHLHQPVVLTNPQNASDVFKTYDNGLVFDSTLYTQHQLDTYLPPILTSDVNTHQHMAIIKQFSTCVQ